MVFDHTQHKDKKSCLATDMLLQAGLIAAPGCAFLADTSHLCLCQVHPSGLGVQTTPTVAVFTLFVSLTPILTTLDIWGMIWRRRQDRGHLVAKALPSRPCAALTKSRKSHQQLAEVLVQRYVGYGNLL